MQGSFICQGSPGKEIQYDMCVHTHTDIYTYIQREGVEREGERLFKGNWLTQLSRLTSRKIGIVSQQARDPGEPLL